VKGARLGVLRQVFTPAVTDPGIIARFETTLAELKAAGAGIVDPFIAPEFDAIPRPRCPPTKIPKRSSAQRTSSGTAMPSPRPWTR
jgi:amidase